MLQIGHCHINMETDYETYTYPRKLSLQTLPFYRMINPPHMTFYIRMIFWTNVLFSNSCVFNCHSFIYLLIPANAPWRKSLKYLVRVPMCLSRCIYGRTFITGHVICIFYQVESLLNRAGVDFNISSLTVDFNELQRNLMFYCLEVEINERNIWRMRTNVFHIILLNKVN